LKRKAALAVLGFTLAVIIVLSAFAWYFADIQNQANKPSPTPTPTATLPPTTTPTATPTPLPSPTPKPTTRPYYLDDPNDADMCANINLVFNGHQLNVTNISPWLITLTSVQIKGTGTDWSGSQTLNPGQTTSFNKIISNKQNLTIEVHYSVAGDIDDSSLYVIVPFDYDFYSSFPQ
jgi:hypothetical protein